jgi:outer membrane protein
MRELVFERTRPARDVRSMRGRALACLLALCVVVPAEAQTAGSTGGTPAAATRPLEARVAPRPAAPQLEIQDNAIALSLDRAVEVALSQNLGLLIERYNRTQTAFGVYQALGIYDLLARADAEITRTDTARVNVFQADTTKIRRLNVFGSQLLPTGGQLDLGWTNGRAESAANEFNLRNLNYSPNLTFALNQPLLRDFGRLATERQLILARTNSQISRQELERQAGLILQSVINAYWNLVGARDQLVVAEQSLSLARELDQRNRIEVEVGTRAPLELVQSEATIATREEDIIRATSAVGDNEDELRRLLNLPPGELWELAIRPTTDPVTPHSPIDVEAAIATALGRRPELRSQELAIERAEVEEQFFRNQERPQLNLELSYGLAGAGDAYSDALRQVTDLDFPDWTAALRFSYPIQNRAARAQSTIARLDVERTNVELEQLQAVVRTEVRQAARGVETAAKQIDAARASVRFQERNLDAERKRYENGMSTSFQITQIQEDLTLARSREVAAIVAYRTALAEYWRATGTLLDQQGVQVLDDEPIVDRWTFRRGFDDARRTDQR